MKAYFQVLKLEWLLLWRSNVLKVMLLVVLGAGLYGIFFGEYEIEKQDSRIAEVEIFERQQFDSLLVWSKLDTGNSVNSEKYMKAVSPVGAGWSKHFTYYQSNYASPLAGLCLGQRDLYPVYYGFNMTDLARQINTVELANPLKLLTGNFDLSYVFIFLFPLLIVALYYDLFAHEKENGILPLMRAQSSGIWRVFITKALLRLLVVWAISALLLVLGFVLQEIPLRDHMDQFATWLLIIFGYCFFWAVITCLIVSLQKSSTLNAMLGLGVWLILTLVVPALLNLYVLANAPVPNRSEMIHALRTMNDENWENPRAELLNRFYDKYPEYYDGDTVDFYKWYYAAFALIDLEANEWEEQFEAQVVERNKMLDKLKWLAPAAMVHEKLASLSRTDRQSHIEFVKTVQEYHAELKSLYYKRIFEGKNFSENDLTILEQKL